MARPDIKVGERWIYHRMDYRTNQLVETFQMRVTFVGKDAIHAVVTTRRVAGKPSDVRVGRVPTLPDKEDGTDATWTSEWNTVAAPGGAVMHPHNGMFRFPLTVGASHTSHYELRLPREGDRAARVEQTVKVVGWEEVSVPAGTFRALKVEASGRYQWLGKGKRRENLTCWYSPEVKRAVKCIRQDGAEGKRGDELVAFELR